MIRHHCMHFDWKAIVLQKRFRAPEWDICLLMNGQSIYVRSQANHWLAFTQGCNQASGRIWVPVCQVMLHVAHVDAVCVHHHV